MADDKIQKLKNRVKLALDSKDFYTACQVIRTLYYRMLEMGMYTELLDLLYNGFNHFCEAKEFNCATDIAELYASVLPISNVDISEEVLDQTIEMFSRLPARIEETGNICIDEKDRRTTFINRIVNWSLTVAQNRVDKLKETAQLHLRLSQVYGDEGNYSSAQKHLRAAALLNRGPEISLTANSNNEASSSAIKNKPDIDFNDLNDLD